MGLRGAVPEEIWLASSAQRTRQWTKRISERCEKRFSKAIEALEDSLAFYVFPSLGTRKISSTNMLEWLNQNLRERNKHQLKNN